MFSLKRRTKRFIFVFIVLYVTAWATSAIDLGGDMSNLFCGIITLIVSIGCFGVGARAYVLAKIIEKAPRWHSNCTCRGSAIQVAVGYLIWTVMLGLLKAKSVFTLFVEHWHSLPPSYHFDSWAYLSVNSMGVLLAWVVLNMLQSKHDCAQLPKTILTDKVIIHR